MNIENINVLNRTQEKIEDLNISCAYAIYSKCKNKRYVGSTSNLYKRLQEHFNLLEKNNHHSFKLQNDYNNNEYFCIEILEIIFDLKDRYIIEQKYIDLLNSHDLGYNIHPIAGYIGDYEQYLSKIDGDFKNFYKDYEDKKKELFENIKIENRFSDHYTPSRKYKNDEVILNKNKLVKAKQYKGEYFLDKNDTTVSDEISKIDLKNIGDIKNKLLELIANEINEKGFAFNVFYQNIFLFNRGTGLCGIGSWKQDYYKFLTENNLDILEKYDNKIYQIREKSSPYIIVPI